MPISIEEKVKEVRLSLSLDKIDFKLYVLCGGCVRLKDPKINWSGKVMISKDSFRRRNLVFPCKKHIENYLRDIGNWELYDEEKISQF